MTNILFIHGFGGDKTSSTGQNVKTVLNKLNYEFNYYTDTFELMDYEGTISQIDNIVKEHKITTIIAHSFGAFYALAYKGSQKKIIINPCMLPSVEIPKLLKHGTPGELESFEKYFKSQPQKFVETFKAAEEQCYSPENNSSTRVFGIFANNDENFTYKEKFISLYPAPDNKNAVSVEGGHKVGIEELERVIPGAVKYINL